jgi:hypothetical protein
VDILLDSIYSISNYGVGQYNTPHSPIKGYSTMMNYESQRGKWFPECIHPTKPGWYKTLHSGSDHRYWDGEVWRRSQRGDVLCMQQWTDIDTPYPPAHPTSPITYQQHLERHLAADKLVVDWICKTGNTPSHATVQELMEWSHNQAISLYSKK